MNPGGNHFIPGLHRRRVMLLGMTFAVMFSAACGKKGPLYLPDEAVTPDKTGTQAVSPAATQPEKK